MNLEMWVIHDRPFPGVIIPDVWDVKIPTPVFCHLNIWSNHQMGDHLELHTPSLPSL